MRKHKQGAQLLDIASGAFRALADANLGPYERGDNPLLTERQRQVLYLLADGWLMGEVAEGLGINLRTARTHYDRAKWALDAKNREHAVAIAIRKRLI